MRLALQLLCILSLTVIFTLPADYAHAVRIKDLASVKGVRSNQLIGYGLVVGLNGTGDGNKAAFTTQALVNMLKSMGIPVNENDIKVKNVAGVLVTANLPPFVKAGQAIDVVLSSLGDASSLQGGTLVATPLKGLDDQVYAVAQGPISIGGFQSTGAPADGIQANHLTVARIPDGATVEREVPVSFAGKKEIILSLNTPDFTTISRLSAAVNSYLNGPFATAVDGATVSIQIPENMDDQQIGFIASIENIEVIPDSTAKVVVDERTGTIVMGENVRISNLALSHGNLSIQVSDKPNSPIPNEMIGQILTDEMVRKMTDAISTPGGNAQQSKLINLTPGVTLGEMVRALNSVGAAPRDLIAIFQAIKAAGALQAELKII
nr:flagellar basal body P-ring protein FlgI [Desulfobulbaceae bacterium]